MGAEKLTQRDIKAARFWLSEKLEGRPTALTEIAAAVLLKTCDSALAQLAQQEVAPVAIRTDTILPCPNPWCRLPHHVEVVRLAFQSYVICKSCRLVGPLREEEYEPNFGTHLTNRGIEAWNTRPTPVHLAQALTQVLDVLDRQMPYHRSGCVADGQGLVTDCKCQLPVLVKAMADLRSLV